MFLAFRLSFDVDIWALFWLNNSLGYFSQQKLGDFFLYGHTVSKLDVIIKYLFTLEEYYA